MDTLNSFIGFFYNIIPGFVFLLLNSLFFWPVQKIIIESNKHSYIGLVPVLVISIMLGFLFQALTKLFRSFCLDKIITKDIENKDKYLLTVAKNELTHMKLHEKDEDTIKFIYTIHNYLFAKYSNEMIPEFIMPRLALWSNMFFVFILTIFSILISPWFFIFPQSISGFMPFDLLLLILLSCISLKTYLSYHYAYFDSLLRTFVSTQSLDNNAKFLAKPLRKGKPRV